MTHLCERPRVLLHIGLPKTGTTSLQTQLFDRHDGIRHFGQSNLWTDPIAKTVLRALLVNEPDTEQTARKHIAQALEQGVPVVISDEAFSLGEFMLRAQQWPIDSTPETVAARARRVLGKVHILIVLRNQSDWLISWHRQGLKTGKYTQTKFKRWLERDLGSARRDRLFELLDYTRLVSAYTEQFGADLVDVRFYEHYRDDFPPLASGIAQTLGLNDTEACNLLAKSPAANVTRPLFRGVPPELLRPARTVAGRAVLDRIPKRYRIALRELFVRDRAYEYVDELTCRQIRAQFRASNLALVDLLGLDQVPKGYV